MSKVLCLATLMVVQVVVLVSTPVLTRAQEGVDVPDCVTDLDDPCGPFVNSTTAIPPAACCQPLEMVLKNDISCLCTIFGSIDIIQTLSINVTEALTLPQRCGFQFDIIAQCQAMAPAPSSTPAIAPSPISGME
ncbi:non-specific lipid transfer protein GPI-anchored 3-like [Spinacia oleracea]|uniref:Non-specific lipid transfer protein GPI-anchored 3-like n=1 Tax=Spinacia oleracea TaxID=3562 RepID=A0A9R0IUR0_SPIOL|nr:non-specific lipid transfer protein GPI-anchored 3-like [Spinacia oleracea]